MKYKVTEIKDADITFAIDLSNLAYITYHTDSGHINGFVKRILNYIFEFKRKTNALVFILDNPSLRKYELYPEYKGYRTEKEVDPRPQIIHMCKSFKCLLTDCKDEEADELSSF